MLNQAQDHESKLTSLRENSLPGLRHQLQLAQRKYDDIQEMKQLEKKRNTLRLKLAWAQVAEKEQELQEAQQNVEKATTKVQKRTEKEAELQGRVEQSQQEQVKLTTELNDMEARLRQDLKEKEALKADWQTRHEAPLPRGHLS